MFKHIEPHKNPDYERSIDDIVAVDVKYIHIEQMDTDCIWMVIDTKNFHFYIDGKFLKLKHSWDNPTDKEADA